MGNEISTQIYNTTESLYRDLDLREQPVLALLSGLVVFVGSKVALKWVGDWRERRELSARRKAKQSSREMLLQVVADKLGGAREQILQDVRDSISAMSCVELVKALETGHLKSSDVLTVLQEKALEAQKQTNCLVEPILDADRMAAEADIKATGPFYGLPISIKDNVSLAGYDSTLGCTRLAFKPSQEDSVIVQVLKKQGAIPFVRTNIPQTMMSWSCWNPIYGRTCNPHDHDRGPGGSSGGEAALIAQGGSVIGVGSDVGGSVRIPANMCGICALKPTHGRLSGKGLRSLKNGQALIRACPGPMARDVDSLVFFMKNMLVPYMFELDPKTPPIPFNTQVYEDKRPLRIGFYMQDGYVQAVPAMERGVAVAKLALEKAGHTLVAWQPPRVADGTTAALSQQTLNGDAAKIYVEACKNDVVDDLVKNGAFLYKVRSIASWILKPILKLWGENRLADVANYAGGVRSVTDWWALTEEVEDYRNEVIEEWQNLGLDAVICPGFACPAVTSGSEVKSFGAASYTLLYNLLNFPAGSVPVTKVTSEDEAKMVDYPCKELWERTIKKAMNGSTGLPVNVQCVTLPYQEELCLRIMKEVQTQIT